MAKTSLRVEKPSRLKKEFRPRTPNQENCVISIAENTVTIINGVAGTGKTAISCAMAASYLREHKIEKIFITRPMVQCSRGNNTLGALKGDLDEKFHPYMTPLIEELVEYLGKFEFDNYVEYSGIEIVPIELCRGRSLENTLIIVDECQNATWEQIVLMLTRIGKGSKIILTGDTKQKDIKDNSFEIILDKLRLIRDVGVCTLGVEDIQRHPIVGQIITALEA
jgi:phosphate starvation-inducible PhoH-like protein